MTQPFGEPPPTEVLISLAWAEVKRASQALEKVLEQSCPGPHRYVQHRDRRSAWCSACGRTASGEKVTKR